MRLRYERRKKREEGKGGKNGVVVRVAGGMRQSNSQGNGKGGFLLWEKWQREHKLNINK